MVSGIFESMQSGCKTKDLNHCPKLYHEAGFLLRPEIIYKETCPQRIYWEELTGGIKGSKGHQFAWPTMVYFATLLSLPNIAFVPSQKLPTQVW